MTLIWRLPNRSEKMTELFSYILPAVSYIAVLIVALPILAMIVAFVFVFSKRSDNINGNQTFIQQKNKELTEELEKAKNQQENDTNSDNPCPPAKHLL